MERAEPERVELVELIVGDVDAAIGAFGEGFLDCLLGALGAHRNGDDFAAVLFLQAQCFFERVAIGLVCFESDVGFANPRAAFDDGEGRIFGGNLFDADSDFQDSSELESYNWGKWHDHAKFICRARHAVPLLLVTARIGATFHSSA